MNWEHGDAEETKYVVPLLMVKGILDSIKGCQDNLHQEFRENYLSKFYQCLIKRLSVLNNREIKEMNVDEYLGIVRDISALKIAGINESC